MKALKKAMATMLVMALCLTGVSYQKQTVKAADVNVVFDEGVDVVAGTPFTQNVTLTSASDVIIDVSALEKIPFTCSVLDSSGKDIAGSPLTVTTSDAGWGSETVEGLTIVYYTIPATLNAGTYTIKLDFAESQRVAIYIATAPAQVTATSTPTPTATPIAPTLDFNNITVTKGFKEKISIANAGGAKLTYTSSNAKVATVDANGVVTGKNTGSADITIKTSTGYTLLCKVTVKKNVYSTAQMSGKDVLAGNVSLGVHNISYDKKGNLVIKAKLVNKSGRKAKYLRKLKITIKNSAGKKIGTFSKKKMTVNLNSGKAKKYTFKIKKSKVKQNQDLRIITQAEIGVKGEYVYRR